MLLSERNKDIYSVSVMCKDLELLRNTYYYESKERISKDDVTHGIIGLFVKK